MEQRWYNDAKYFIYFSNSQIYVGILRTIYVRTSKRKIAIRHSGIVLRPNSNTFDGRRKGNDPSGLVEDERNYQPHEWLEIRTSSFSAIYCSAFEVIRKLSGSYCTALFRVHGIEVDFEICRRFGQFYTQSLCVQTVMCTNFISFDVLLNLNEKFWWSKSEWIKRWKKEQKV